MLLAVNSSKGSLFWPIDTFYSILKEHIFHHLDIWLFFVFWFLVFVFCSSICSFSENLDIIVVGGFNQNSIIMGRLTV